MSQPTVPVWLLDIDGVVNALARGPVPNSFPPEEWRQYVVEADIPGMGRMLLPILVAQPVVEFIRDVYESDRAEVRWHSTWRTAAMSDLAPTLGLPGIPISIAPEWTQRPQGWWKLPAAQRVVASGRRLVWTDDDIDAYFDDIDDSFREPQALLVSPNPETGLTRSDLDRISEFLSR